MEENMKIRKIFPVLLLAVLLASTAWADNVPEFDAVGTDSANYFAQTNLPYVMVTDWWAGQARSIEAFSNFVGERFTYMGWDLEGGRLFEDPCYDLSPKGSAITARGNYGWYQWEIVLQMNPESDINLNIFDCVLKPQGAVNKGLFGDADQTGHFWLIAEQYFVRSMNPKITVTATAGRNNYNYGTITLDARKMPTLCKTELDQKYYTSKAHWEEGIVIALPWTGCYNSRGGMEYDLRAGDKITVLVEIDNTPVDIYYGQDNVILKYVGVLGTQVFASN
jgi:hypothetical protein